MPLNKRDYFHSLHSICLMCMTRYMYYFSEMVIVQLLLKVHQELLKDQSKLVIWKERSMVTSLFGVSPNFIIRE